MLPVSALQKKKRIHRRTKLRPVALCMYEWEIRNRGGETAGKRTREEKRHRECFPSVFLAECSRFV